MTIHRHENQVPLNGIPDPSTGSVGQAITVKSGGGYELTTVSGSTPDAIKKTINQSSHGLSAGDVVRYNGSAYVTAQADIEDNAEAVGIVESVTDTNNFVMVVEGYVSITGMSWTAGSTYRLSEDTAGALTADDPDNDGVIVRPLLNALSATTGWFSVKLGFLHYTNAPAFVKLFGAMYDIGQSVLDVLDFVTETVGTETLGGSWTSNNTDTYACVGSPATGYLCGGGTSTGQTSIINAIRFGDFTRYTASTSMGVAQGGTSGIDSAENGYICGGWTGPANAYVLRLDLDAETVADTGNTLSAGRRQPTTCQSETKGFIMGSVSTLLSSIDKLTFSSEGVGSISTNLSAARGSGMGVNSSTHGYSLGGFTTVAVNTVDKLDLSAETLTTPASTLSTARASGAGVNSATKGYACGGSSQRVDSISFSDDSVSSMGDILAASRTYYNGGGGWQSYGTR